MALATGTYVAGVVSKKKKAMSIHDHQSLSVDMGSVLPSWPNDRDAITEMSTGPIRFGVVNDRSIARFFSHCSNTLVAMHH